MTARLPAGGATGRMEISTDSGVGATSAASQPPRLPVGHHDDSPAALFQGFRRPGDRGAVAGAAHAGSQRGQRRLRRGAIDGGRDHQVGAVVEGDHADQVGGRRAGDRLGGQALGLGPLPRGAEAERAIDGDDGRRRCERRERRR